MNTHHTYRSILWLFGLFLLTLFAPLQVFAHGGAAEGQQQAYTQRVGAYDLIVMVELPLTTPGNLLVDLAPQGSTIPQRISMRAVPYGQSFDQAPPTVIDTIAGPQGIYYSALAVDRTGEWELEVVAEGEAGSGMTRIPITIVPTTLPAYSIELTSALASTALLLIVSLAIGAHTKRAKSELPIWLDRALGQGIFAALIASFIFGGLMWREAAQQAGMAQASTAPTTGRPHVNVALTIEPGVLKAGQPLTLTLDLTDGGTGLPVDDLVSHHEALMHLVVLDDTGAFMQHVHPPRISPGRYSIVLTPDRPGRYSAYTEIERIASGTQVIIRDFEVAGAPVATPDPAPGPGPHMVEGLQVTLAANEPIRAGKQTTLSFSFQDAEGQPIQDLQPWLGMAGHMFARSTDQATFAHIHAAEAMAPAGVTGLGIRYGPTIRFVYTFPQSGSYQVWAQFQHNGIILTIPATIVVQE
jgi:hypothetical protein